MNKINLLELALFKNDDNKEIDKNKQVDESNIKPVKVLCNHCGRTAENGIRCLGICVADNEY